MAYFYPKTRKSAIADAMAEAITEFSAAQQLDEEEIDSDNEEAADGVAAVRKSTMMAMLNDESHINLAGECSW